MQGNILKEKVKLFASRSLDLYKNLIMKKEYVLSKQFLRSSTSIGANVFVANYSESKKDFTHKLHISLKEAVETGYWLELIERYNPTIKDIKLLEKLNDEIIRPLISSIKISKRTNK
ncbi:MAG TPA: four helix bundle protein [Candidatus Dojkabacteria bacterium]|nr:four helix bundle protein [Candidatus Dojkabacteria bacterium]